MKLIGKEYLCRGKFYEGDEVTSIKIGEWKERRDGLWALRIDSLPETDE